MNRKILYLECQSGISGDMTVAALLDLGADREAMERAVNSLPVSGFRTEISRVSKSGLDACDFNVILDAAHENHDHDMEYLHGHDHAEAHSHTCPEHDHAEAHSHTCSEHDHAEAHSHICSEHDHAEDHTHGNEDHIHTADSNGYHTHDGVHYHTHEHQTLPGILHILSHGDMTDSARALAEKIFGILADAEAKAHGIPREQVHFHEVGAVDSIVDITAAAVCLDSLGVEDVVIPELCEGRGWVRCQHGMIPVPVPAVMNIAEAWGLILHRVLMDGELVTPTGAAIAAAIRTSEKLPERYRILRTGIGAGKRQYERPSLLRAMLIEPVEAENLNRGLSDKAGKSAGEESMSAHEGRMNREDEIIKLESNIDDCTGETLGYVMEQLMAAGARDVHYMPVFMKKNRPAWQLNVICMPEDAERLEKIIFRETTTIGIRKLRMERSVMEREIRETETPLGRVRMKVCRKDEIVKVYPEYEDLRKICLEQCLSYTEAYQAAMDAWKTENS